MQLHYICLCMWKPGAILLMLSAEREAVGVVCSLWAHVCCMCMWSRVLGVRVGTCVLGVHVFEQLQRPQEDVVWLSLSLSTIFLKTVSLVDLELGWPPVILLLPCHTALAVGVRTTHSLLCGPWEFE